MKKVMKITQDILRTSHRPIKFQIRPDLIIEAGPKIIHPFNRRNENKNWLRWLLPEGYPQSVHDNYLKFSMWTGIQGITSSFIGVLSTQAMLGAVMNISNISNDDSNDGWLSKGTAAATINWILKDGLGQAGGIALVSLLGSRLDNQARFLRFHSNILFLIGSLLEFSIPFSLNISILSNSNTFLILASIANILKNVSWMIISATRAPFMKNFALKENLGDLTGKAASQMTLASLIGTGLGLIVIKFEEIVKGKNIMMISCWVISAVIGILSTHRSCKFGISKQLNPEIIFKILKTFSKHLNKENGPIFRYIWTPEIMALRDNFFIFNQREIFSSSILNLNPPLTDLKEDFNWIVPIEEIESNNFCIAKSKEGNFYIWTLENCKTSEKLISIIKSALNYFKIEEIVNENEIIEALIKQGWDVKNFNCKEFDDKRRSLKVSKKEE